MGAVFFRNKVNVLCVSRIQGGFQGRLPWICDRTGGEGFDSVSVIRRKGFKVFAVQIAIEGLESINNRRIRLQAHFLS